MVVVNPYAKKRPRPESSSGELLYRPPQLFKATTSGSAGLTVSSSLAQTASSQKPVSTGHSLQSVNLNESFDDGGFDWDAAIQQIDNTASGREELKKDINTMATSQNASSGLDRNQKGLPPPELKRTAIPMKKSQVQMSLSTSLTSSADWTKSNLKLSLTLEKPQQWASNTVSAQSKAETQTQLPRILQYDSGRTKPVDDDLRSVLVKNARLGETLKNGWKLYNHQKKAILRALLMRRMILALDMGLGKTLVGCVWARTFQETYGDGLKVICICPVSLTQEWKRTAEEATGVAVEDTGNKHDPESLLMHICSWAKVPSEISPSIRNFVVICDEAHSMQSIEAARTKQVLNLVKSTRCVGALLLTGTPMKNGKPCNLFPLLRAVNHPFGDNLKAYETFFCDGKEKSFGRVRTVWDANGCSNLGLLKEHIASHLLHMTKEECLGKLPPQTRVFRQVPVSSRHQLQHNQALSELATIYASAGTLENSGDVVLTAFSRVRQIASFAKIDATVAIAKEVLQEQPAVVIFSNFATVAKIVHQKLAEAGWIGELLTGETPPKKRQGMVDNFQEGLSPVFISTFGAGGVGLTLTAAHTIILLDRPWTPGEAQQAEDRVRRIGQENPVTSIWMVAFNLDKQIDQLIEQKKNTTQAVLAKGDHQAAITAPKISIFQLLKSVFGSSGAVGINLVHP